MPFIAATIGTNDIVHLRARLEGDDGLIGDWFEEVAPSENLFGKSHAEWKTIAETEGGVELSESDTSK